MNAQQISWSIILILSNSSALIHDLMNIDITQTQYVSVELDKWKICLTNNKYFNYEKREYHHKNYSTNFYNKIWQTIIINLNKSILIRKTYIIFMTSLKKSEKRTHSTSLHVIISHVMFLNELENKLFWDQITFQNTREKNLWCIYAFWVLIRTTEVTHFSTWSAKYNLKKNELRYKFW